MGANEPWHTGYYLCYLTRWSDGKMSQKTLIVHATKTEAEAKRFVKLYRRLFTGIELSYI